MLFEPDASLLSTIDTINGTTITTRPVACAAHFSASDALAGARDGSVVFLSQTGAMFRVSPGPTNCTELGVLPTPRVAYRGLAITRIGNDDAVFTIDLGPANEYLADGTYHHALYRIDPMTGTRTQTATIDMPSYPDRLHPAANGHLTLQTANELALVDPGTGILSVAGVAGPAVIRGTVLDAKNRMFAIGDVHQASNFGLPTFVANIRGAGIVALAKGGDIKLPGASIDGFLTGSAPCAVE